MGSILAVLLGGTVIGACVLAALMGTVPSPVSLTAEIDIVAQQLKRYPGGVVGAVLGRTVPTSYRIVDSREFIIFKAVQVEIEGQRCGFIGAVGRWFRVK